MTTATVAQPSGNQFAVLLCMFLLISFITCVCLWMHERRWDAHEAELAAHAEQLAGLDYRMESLLEFLGVEIPPPVEDDSPEALAGDDADTEEFPVAPATVPDGMPLAVQSALIEQRPVPHKQDEGEMVERSVNIGGTVQTFRIRANRENV